MEEIRAKEQHKGEVAIVRIYTTSFYDIAGVNDSNMDVLNLESNARKNAEQNIRWGLTGMIQDYSNLVNGASNGDGGIDIMGIQDVGWDDKENKTQYRADIMLYAQSN